MNLRSLLFLCALSASPLLSVPASEDTWSPKISENLPDVSDATLAWLALLGSEWVVLQGTDWVDKDGNGYWTKDEIVPVQDVRDFVANGPNLTYQEMAGVSHFFHGQLVPLREVVCTWGAQQSW